MYGKTGFRFTIHGAVLVLAVASSFAAAAEGGSCAVRSVGPASASSATLGHLDADGKCVTKAVAKAAPPATADDGLAASAQCRDLSYSYNKRRESACAKHGGVLEWLAQQ